MGFFEDVRSSVAEKVRPRNREALRGGIVSLDEGGSINRGEISSYELFDLLRKTPEAISLLTAIADDIVQPGYEMNYLGESSGERARKRASNFYEREVKSNFYDVVIDYLATGDGYLYINTIGEETLRSFVLDKCLGEFNEEERAYETAALMYRELEKRAHTDEPVTTQMVPSSTVEHDINKYGDITEFSQELRSSGEDSGVDMHPDSVVHFGYLSLNGGTYNFSPMRSLVTEITLLASSKDHNVKVHENGGRYNKLFNLPNADPESDHYKNLMTTIKQFRQLDNKYRDLALTGELEVEDLNDVSDDMEFRELAEYLTRVMTMAWGVPPARVGITIGGGNGARSTSLMLQGYYNRIRRQQEELAERLNEKIFRPYYNCEIELKDPDVQNEIREAERDMKKTDTALKQMAMGVRSRQSAMKYLGIKEEEMMDLENEDDQALMRLAAQVGTGRDQQLSELEQFGSEAENQMAEDQSEVQSDD